MAELQRQGIAPVVTEIAPATSFYRAEEEHQNYYRLHPSQGYCAFVVAPKLEKFRRTFVQKKRTDPD